MNMKLSAIIDYVSHLIKKYNEIQQTQMQNKFRVVSIKKTSTAIKIIFQVIGKSTFMECTPDEILSNDNFLECFSKKDIQKIASLRTQDQNHSKDHMKLVQQNFNIKDGKTSFVLKDNKGKTSTKTAAEIFNDKELAKKLPRQEAMNISYVAGCEHSQIENLID